MSPKFSLRIIPSMLLLCGMLSSFSVISAAYSADYLSDARSANAAKPELLLAQTYRANVDLAAYLVSEKLDGVRAIWDGNVLRFRSGKIIPAPAWFSAGFPNHPMDGELWMGRGRFDQVSAATRREIPSDDEWKQISYQVVELPRGQGSYNERLSSLAISIASAKVPWLQLLDQFQVADEEQLQSTLKTIVQNKGEGLILHRSDALWQTGRSDVLLKLKLQSDAEATVIGYVPGKGKYLGLTGALLVEMPNGTRFKLGSGLSDELRRNPPAVGAVVTYRYRDITPNGIPRFASFWRVREHE